MNKFPVFIVAIAIITTIIPQLVESSLPRSPLFPCDSHLRKYYPSLFRHCPEVPCQYGQWSVWKKTGTSRTDLCATGIKEQLSRSRVRTSGQCSQPVDTQTEFKCFVFPAANETTRLMNQVFRLSSAPPTTEIMLGNQTSHNRRRRSTICSAAPPDSCTLTVTDPPNSGMTVSHDPCKQLRYFLIILDVSGSIPEEKFEEETDFIATIVEHLCGKIKVAMVSYSSQVKEIFGFDSGKNKVEMAATIRSISRLGQATHTGKALMCAAKNMLKKSRGWPGTPLHLNIITFTDGAHNGICKGSIETIVNTIHNGYSINTEMYVVAYGNPNVINNNLPGIDMLVKNTDNKHIFYIDENNVRDAKVALVEAADQLSMCVDHNGIPCPIPN